MALLRPPPPARIDAGETFYDVDVTQTQHALQTATLARAAGAGDADITSALLHDVGHLLLAEHAGSEEFLLEDLQVIGPCSKDLRVWAEFIFCMKRGLSGVILPSARTAVETYSSAGVDMFCCI